METQRQRLRKMLRACDDALAVMERTPNFPRGHPVRRHVLALRRRTLDALAELTGPPFVRSAQRVLAVANVSRRPEPL